MRPPDLVGSFVGLPEPTERSPQVVPSDPKSVQRSIPDSPWPRRCRAHGTGLTCVPAHAAWGPTCGLELAESAAHPHRRLGCVFLGWESDRPKKTDMP